MMMSSVPSVKFIKVKVIFRNHTKGVSNQVSSNSDQEIKSHSCSNSSIKTRKNEKVGKFFFGLHNGAIRRLQIGAAFRSYKLGQDGLQIGRSFRDFKSGQNDYKLGLGFQIGEKRIQIRAEITNRGNRDFKSGQGLQIGAEHT